MLFHIVSSKTLKQGILPANIYLNETLDFLYKFYQKWESLQILFIKLHRLITPQDSQHPNIWSLVISFYDRKN